MVYWIKRKLYAKILGLFSRFGKMICLSSNFRDRQTDIVAYRGDECNQRVYWILGKLHAKKSKTYVDKKDKRPFRKLSQTNRPTNQATDQPTDGHEGS